MTREEVAEAFVNAESRPLAEGLYDIDGFLHLIEMGWRNEGLGKSILGCARHDQIWLGVDMDWFCSVATIEDINFLHDCNIWYNEGDDCLGMFV